ncbi:hypothetical protein [Thalassospira sp. MIT1370]|uniref:hypothetical protein n=1 Tax=unclassified Thalassospira TaxID=2648997 RepID=UPI00399BEA87
MNYVESLALNSFRLGQSFSFAQISLPSVFKYCHIRGNFLSHVLSAKNDYIEKIQIYNTYIDGKIELHFQKFTPPIIITGCTINSEIKITHSQISTVCLQHCHINKLSLDETEISGALILRNSKFACGISCKWTQISHSINLDSAQLGTHKVDGYEVSFNGDGLSVGGGATFNSNFSASGQVRLIGADVGFLDLEQSKITCKNGPALVCNQLRCKGYFLLNSATIEGACLLESMNVNQIEVGNSSFTENSPNNSDPSISLNNSIISNSLNFTSHTYCIGHLSMLGVKIGDCLTFRSVHLQLKNAELTSRTLSLDRSQIAGLLHFSDNTIILGEASLRAVEVAGQLMIENSEFEAQQTPAFSMQSGVIKQEALIRSSSFNGVLDLSNVTVGLDLEFAESIVVNPDAPAFVAENLVVKNTLKWFPAKIDGAIGLHGASVRSLADKELSWPTESQVDLNGFSYQSLSWAAPISSKFRLAWLSRQFDGFKPQPYSQLARTLQTAGEFKEARIILYHREEQRRKNALRLEYLWLSALKYTVGYGYKTSRILWSILLLFALSLSLSYTLIKYDLLEPSKETMYTNSCYTIPSASCNDWFINISENTNRITWLPYSYQIPNPAFLALDISLPILNFNQEENWNIRSKSKYYFAISTISLILKTWGWVVFSLLAASISGIIRRDEP